MASIKTAVPILFFFLLVSNWLKRSYALRSFFAIGSSPVMMGHGIGLAHHEETGKKIMGWNWKEIYIRAQCCCSLQTPCSFCFVNNAVSTIFSVPVAVALTSFVRPWPVVAHSCFNQFSQRFEKLVSDPLVSYMFCHRETNLFVCPLALCFLPFRFIYLFACSTQLILLVRRPKWLPSVVNLFSPSELGRNCPVSGSLCITLATN